mmetsp:Transcript_45185/g.88396  ORF Transcript_45185/g.88396 Transcript_45185/m.88396 type:complete len:538 (-) Transcript_45185:44-1657(-)
MTNVETTAPVVLSRSFDSKIRRWKYPLLALGSFTLVLLGTLGIPYVLLRDTDPGVRGSTDLSESDLGVDPPGGLGLGENHMIWYVGDPGELEPESNETLYDDDGMFEFVSFDYRGSVKQAIMGISGKEQIELDGSPHFKAFEWANAAENRMILGKNRTIISKGRTIQRYILALLKFSWVSDNASTVKEVIDTTNMTATEIKAAEWKAFDVLESWANRENECKWKGVRCHDDGYVRKIDLTDIFLGGALPPELSRLSWIRELLLHGCGLTGVLPPDLGLLSQLETLDLSANQLTGSIPEELYDCRKMQVLRLGFNQLTGTLSSKMGQLSRRLVDLRLDYNRLVGTIPPEIGMLKNARFIILRSNYFSRYLPYTLGGLDSVMYLDVSANQLRGPLPLGIAKLRKLNQLYLDNNQFSGAIPTEWSHFGVQVFEIHLNDNRLKGTIPERWGGGLPFLGTLRVQNNRFSTTIPENLCAMHVFLENSELMEVSADCSICSCRVSCKWCYLDGKRVPNPKKKLADDLLGFGLGFNVTADYPPPY